MKTSVVRSLGEGGLSRQSTEDFEGSDNTLSDTVMVETHPYTFVQTFRMCSTKGDPNIDCGLCVMMCV